MYTTLKKLMPLIPSVSGREHTVRGVIADLMKPLADEVKTDAMGNLICLKRGSGPQKRKVMLEAHMDEIGFITTFVEDNGWIRVAPVGGISFRAAVDSHVVFENGTKGALVLDDDAPADEAIKAEKCYIDIGARNKKEAERHVKVGDCAALVPHVERLLGSRICGRPIDNRIGCAILVQLAKKLSSPADDIYYVFSVQEEVGCRGARPASFAISPDVALIYDVTGTGDTPGAKPMAVKVGGGVAVKIKDASVICDQRLVEELLTAAKNADIPHQCEILTYGGTDTSSVQMNGFGCRAGALSIPSRYIHSGVELVDLKDAEAALDLTLAYLGGK